ncbi:MAG TPA: cytosine deaminase [Cyanobacteria bacterium UBA8553]|nr:cytosine deaminase [Cyanobacteria bacterium UBA8553]HAJ59315.1 cytosine deaminase [Cyanobacteria bacterium UBA8543]
MRLIHQQKIWVLTTQGWLLSITTIVILILFCITHVHPFLAPYSPVKADILVVEGWLEDYVIKNAMKEFEKGSYQKLITTGLPLPRGYYLSQHKSFAELSAATLITLGFDPDKLVAVPAKNVTRNRTDASATALRQWIANSGLKVKSINLYTFDVHSRRSWLIFKQTLAPEIKVGVIAVESRSYDPKRWWTSSEGVRSIISETIAYLYARFVSWKR